MFHANVLYHTDNCGNTETMLKYLGEASGFA
jgi:hypothetical protein